MKSFLKNNAEKIILLLIILVGATLRFYNLNWDEGHSFHPDERNITNAVLKIHFFDKLNPEFFSYGGFLIYVYRATGDVISFLTDSRWILGWESINIIGRHFSALFSTLTVIPLYFLAKKLYNKKVALLAVYIFVFTVSSIQSAHFAITESFITLMGVVITLLSIYIAERPTLTRYVLTGLCVGTAVAAKTSALAFFIYPISAYIVVLFRSPSRFLQKKLYALVLFAVGGIVFFVFSPYTLLRWDKFIEAMRYESGVATGMLAVPYTLQFTNTPPYIFQLQNLLWQMGPIALLIAGVFYLILDGIKAKNLKLFIFFTFPIMYFLYVGQWHTKFIRYMVPLLPFFIIIISYILYVLIKRYKLFGNIIAALFLVTSACYALAFFSIYTRPQTKIIASEWIYENIPPDSKILGEHWDDGLPITVGFFYPNIYKIEQLTIYEPDDSKKINYYAEKLSENDYIIISSRKLYGTLINLPEKYPITSHYYKLLFGDKLGYKKVAEFTSYPQLFGFEINDDKSEETFQVYEHPKVIVFKNTARLDKKMIENLLSLQSIPH